MSKIYFIQNGDWGKTKKYLEKLLKINDKMKEIMNRYGKIGVSYLENNTPIRSGITSSSWGYKIEEDKNGISLVFLNNNVNKGLNIAILIQYGHGTKNGGYVEGIDYINPSLQLVFQSLAESAWKEVTT